MKRNQTINNFTSVPSTRRPRTRFTPKGTVKTSFNAGKLVPIMVREVLPNTTMKLDLTSVVRGITPLAPVLDNAYVDVFAFFVPNRLSWDHWEDFLSEPSPKAYEQAPQYSVPQIHFRNVTEGDTYQELLAGKFWDYASCGAASKDTALFGDGVNGYPALSALFPRGYVRIWNEWFRDQNVQDEAHLYTDDADRPYNQDGDPMISAEYGAELLPVSKYKDYFTSALPQAQKGPPVSIFSVAGDIPITNELSGKNFFSPIWWRDDATQAGPGGSVFANTEGPPFHTMITPGAGQGASAFQAGLSLKATLGDSASVTVNALRLAFQTQRFQERLARSGSRYTELLRSMFGVYASDARLQRSEYLGGRRFPITQHQVAQTAENGQSIGLGDTGAFVFTADKSNRIVDRSFPEHGIVYVLACVRTDQSYSQGVPVQFTRRNRFDYYFPCFAHIGEMPIRRKEIYATGYSSNDEEVFGYKEPWVEYKYMENIVTAKMRPYVDNNFGIWSYAVEFEQPPVLSPSFIQQDVAEIDRTLAVKSTVQDQFFGDFYFDFKALDLPMPLYNTPGLIDHD